MHFISYATDSPHINCICHWFPCNFLILNQMSLILGVTALGF